MMILILCLNGKYKMKLNEYEIETKKIKFINVETGLIKQFTLSQMLYEINRDRSKDWQDYDLTNWKKGMEVFTEWRLYEK